MHWFSSPAFAVLLCGTNRKPLLSGCFAQVTMPPRYCLGHENVGWLPHVGGTDVEVVITALTTHTIYIDDRPRPGPAGKNT